MGFNGDLESLTIHPASLPIQTITKCDGAVVHNNVTTLIPLLLQLYLARSEGGKQVPYYRYATGSVLQLSYLVCKKSLFLQQGPLSFQGDRKTKQYLGTQWFALTCDPPSTAIYLQEMYTNTALYLRFHTALYRLLGVTISTPSPRHSVLIVEPFVSMFIPQNSL